MRKGQTVSYERLNRALRHVQGVLEELGIYDKLDHVEVHWCELPQLSVPAARGFFTHGDQGFFGRLVGYDAGHIFIPKIVPLQLWRQNRGSLRGLLLHEYAHAVAYYYPAIVAGRMFSSTFGGPYGWQVHRGEQPKEACVSAYAMTSPAENFAETVEFWITNRLNSRIKGVHPMLARKFRFVASVITRLQSASRAR